MKSIYLDPVQIEQSTPRNEEFCLADNVETCRHADCTLHHLDGPGTIKHVLSLLGIEEHSMSCHSPASLNVRTLCQLVGD